VKNKLAPKESPRRLSNGMVQQRMEPRRKNKIFSNKVTGQTKHFLNLKLPKEWFATVNPTYFFTPSLALIFVRKPTPKPWNIMD
jgi:hypothetical protein